MPVAAYRNIFSLMCLFWHTLKKNFSQFLYFFTEYHLISYWSTSVTHPWRFFHLTSFVFLNRDANSWRQNDVTWYDKLTYESLKSKFSLILFAYNYIWWSDTLKRIEKILWESAFDQKKKKPGLKFNPELALSGARPTVLGFVIQHTQTPYLF